ncbi:AlpA family phage regulatory protein [Pseudomonas moorei]|uniref:AlpA family phage regulatory protein n=1 Tax=Pseudomonas moorei TaxID=395599 RepID=UPI0036F25EF4
MPLGERCVDWLESEVREWIIGKVRRGNYWLEFFIKGFGGDVGDGAYPVWSTQS